MNRKYAIAILITMSIATTPLQAQKWPELNKENISKGLGAITGAIIGSKIGGGSGRSAAIAAGALAGYWAGGKIKQRLTELDRQGINQATSKAMSTGRDTTWRNPDTGTSTQVSVQDYSPPTKQGLKPKLDRLPPIELLNAYYVPTANINVRGWPGTDYQIVHSIHKNQPVPVVGKVINSNWYLIAEQGKASGFLYAPLMNADDQQVNRNAIRAASLNSQPGRYIVQSNNCRVITQKISVRGGGSESHQFNACQQANGQWVRT